MNRVLRTYVPYDDVVKYGLSEVMAKVINDWENKLQRSLKNYYCDITHEFIVITYEVKFELILPMYKLEKNT